MGVAVQSGAWRLGRTPDGTPGYLDPDWTPGEVREQWRARHFTPAELLRAELSGDAVDPDGDGLSNLAEFLAGTDPLDREHALRFESVTRSGTEVRLAFVAVSGRRYRIERTASPGQPWEPRFLLGPVTGTRLETVREPSGPTPWIYRLVVEP
jgi:Bacterial TSP3 repeat